MIKHTKFDNVDICIYQQAKKGNMCNGDSFFIHETKHYFICAVADGLGSGPKARDSSVLAMEMVRAFQDQEVDFILQKCNHALKFERGAVVTVIKYYYQERKVHYSNVGNIKFMLFSPSAGMIHPLPTAGFLSGRPQTITVQYFPVKEHTSFIIFSDGLKVHSLQKFLCEVDTPLETSQQLKNKVQEKPMDDVTFLVGKFL